MNLRIRAWPIVIFVGLALIWALSNTSPQAEQYLLIILALSVCVMAIALDAQVVSNGVIHKILTWYANHIHTTSNPQKDPMPKELAAMIEEEEDDQSN